MLGRGRGRGWSGLPAVFDDGKQETNALCVSQDINCAYRAYCVLLHD